MSELLTKLFVKLFVLFLTKQSFSYNLSDSQNFFIQSLPHNAYTMLIFYVSK